MWNVRTKKSSHLSFLQTLWWSIWVMFLSAQVLVFFFEYQLYVACVDDTWNQGTVPGLRRIHSWEGRHVHQQCSAWQVLSITEASIMCNGSRGGASNPLSGERRIQGRFWPRRCYEHTLIRGSGNEHGSSVGAGYSSVGSVQCKGGRHEKSAYAGNSR